jgi:dihydrofolate synthase / folylpolyglutamate synthase
VKTYLSLAGEDLRFLAVAGFEYHRFMAEDRQLAQALARLDALTNWESRPRSAMRVGLEPMLDLAARLGDPQKSFRSIHVAGTKGKGSVSALIEVALARAALRVGRYASPHVERITERVSLEGRDVDEATLARALDRALDAYEAARKAGTPAAGATWFDLLTAAAFIIFAETQREWAVVEVGLGGRLDSTNIVMGEIAVVTNIGLEHTEILGKTRAAIAGEKAGILKPGAVLITSLDPNDEAGRVVQARAEELGVSVIRPPLAAAATIEEMNVALAGAALDQLGALGLRAGSTRNREPVAPPPRLWGRDGVGGRADYGTPSVPVKDDMIASNGGRRRDPPPGLPHKGGGGPTGAATSTQSVVADAPVGAWLLDAKTRVAAHLPGRMERFDIEVGARRVPVVLDGAHVPFNLEAVLSDLAGTPDLSGPCVAIVALAADKDANGFVAELGKRALTIVFTDLPGSNRGRSPAELQALATSLGLNSEAEPDANRAFRRGAELASEANAWLLVTGSLYLVGALRNTVGQKARRLA